MKKIIKYKGKKWIEYKEPFFKLKSIDFAFFFGLLIGCLNFSGWYFIITFLCIMSTYIAVSWMYELELENKK